MASRKKPRHAPNFSVEKRDGKIILFNPGRTSKVSYLNESAEIIWDLCDGNRTVVEITRLLEDAFPDDAAGMREQVDATLKTFADQGALEFV
ncbi:MAG: PqqD family protein [Vicinamibacterales bacterium]